MIWNYPEFIEPSEHHVAFQILPDDWLNSMKLAVQLWTKHATSFVTHPGLFSPRITTESVEKDGKGTSEGEQSSERSV